MDNNTSPCQIQYHACVLFNWNWSLNEARAFPQFPIADSSWTKNEKLRHLLTSLQQSSSYPSTEWWHIPCLLQCCCKPPRQPQVQFQVLVQLPHIYSCSSLMTPQCCILICLLNSKTRPAFHRSAWIHTGTSIVADNHAWELIPIVKMTCWFYTRDAWSTMKLDKDL